MSNKNGLRIAISGRSGCGNTTVSRLLAERLGLKLVNYTFRTIADEDGISFDDVCRRAETGDEDDLRVDKTQVALARKEPSVLGSRLAIWMLKDADLKVFLTGSPEVRAARIKMREGGTLEDQMKATTVRDKRDFNRYKKLYGIDNNDYSIADLVINTDRFDAVQVVDIIVTASRG
ncbi:MAG: cytidylate kinase family protein [Spirochaetaceae bacterium]|nr:cytidylate kinase family protein [Spirochaetaceae bacterium]RKX85454.1 MAG: cytidylate kinase [Spirochaetota bacterium]RKX97396.1 MAG: cytidylate kinase [Spirochaetota bacterium]